MSINPDQIRSPDRVALFGGTFDPPHLGHLAIARAAADAFQLDTILFAPAGRQPLKPAGSSASFADRLAMVTLACTADTRFAPSTLDAPIPGGEPNFTVETLRRLNQSLPAATIFNLVGADSFHGLARWRRPDELLNLAEWIVVSRPGFPLRDPEGMTLTPAHRQRIHLLDSVHMDAAATDLREHLQAGDLCKDLLPVLVAEYIHQHGLYRRI